MVPGVGHEHVGADLLGPVARVPEHRLFHDDRNACCHEGDHARARISGAAVYERLDASVADSDSHACQDERQDGGGQLLEALVAVGMVFVSLASCNAVANVGDRRGQHAGG